MSEFMVKKCDSGECACEDGATTGGGFSIPWSLAIVDSNFMPEPQIKTPLRYGIPSEGMVLHSESLKSGARYFSFDAEPLVPGTRYFATMDRYEPDDSRRVARGCTSFVAP